MKRRGNGGGAKSLNLIYKKLHAIFIILIKYKLFTSNFCKACNFETMDNTMINTDIPSKIWTKP